MRAMRPPGTMVPRPFASPSTLAVLALALMLPAASALLAAQLAGQQGAPACRMRRMAPEHETREWALLLDQHCIQRYTEQLERQLDAQKNSKQGLPPPTRGVVYAGGGGCHHRTRTHLPKLGMHAARAA